MLFSFCSNPNDSWNEKTAGIFALRPPGPKHVSMKNVRSAIPVLRTLSRISSSVESQMLFQRGTYRLLRNGDSIEDERVLH